MKNIALILGALAALTGTAFAQTAADVEATDSLNQNAGIRVVEHAVVVSEVGQDAVKIEEVLIVTDVEPNAE